MAISKILLSLDLGFGLMGSQGSLVGDVQEYRVSTFDLFVTNGPRVGGKERIYVTIRCHCCTIYSRRGRRGAWGVTRMQAQSPHFSGSTHQPSLEAALVTTLLK